MIAGLALWAGTSALESDADFRNAQALYAQREALGNHERAAEAFAAVANHRTDDMDAQIWCARTAYYAAHRLRDDKPRMRHIADLGHTCGERLLSKFTTSYEAQVWGLLARFRNASASSWLPPLGEIESLAKQLEALRAASPQEYSAYMLLGALYRELPGWPLSIGDRHKALTLLTQGERLAPNNAEVLLELAGTYRALGDTANARLAYQRCIDQGTGPEELAWESSDARAWAKKMLAELK